MVPLTLVQSFQKRWQFFVRLRKLFLGDYAIMCFCCFLFSCCFLQKKVIKIIMLVARVVLNFDSWFCSSLCIIREDNFYWRVDCLQFMEYNWKLAQRADKIVLNVYCYLETKEIECKHILRHKTSKKQILPVRENYKFQGYDLKCFTQLLLLLQPMTYRGT